MQPYGMEIAAPRDLPLPDEYFNRYVLCHYNSVLSVCCLGSNDLYFGDTHAILHGARLSSYRRLVS